MPIGDWMNYAFNNEDIPAIVGEWDSQIRVYALTQNDLPPTQIAVDALQDMLWAIAESGREVRDERNHVRFKRSELLQMIEEEERSTVLRDLWRLITFQDPKIRLDRIAGMRTEYARMGEYSTVLDAYQRLLDACVDDCHDVFMEYRLAVDYPSDKPPLPGAIAL
jgi:hypothetical protein